MTWHIRKVPRTFTHDNYRIMITKLGSSALIFMKARLFLSTHTFLNIYHRGSKMSSEILSESSETNFLDVLCLYLSWSHHRRETISVRENKLSKWVGNSLCLNYPLWWQHNRYSHCQLRRTDTNYHNRSNYLHWSWRLWYC